MVPREEIWIFEIQKGARGGGSIGEEPGSTGRNRTTGITGLWQPSVQKYRKKYYERLKVLPTHHKVELVLSERGGEKSLSPAFLLKRHQQIDREDSSSAQYRFLAQTERIERRHHIGKDVGMVKIWLQ
jgi:hypothetical protein